MATVSNPTPPSKELSLYARDVPRSVLKGHVILGAIQIAVGCAVVVLTVVNIVAGSGKGYTHMASGFWTAPFFIIAGIAGCRAAAGTGNTQCCVVGCLVLSIIAAILGFICLIMESLFTANNRWRFEANSTEPYSQRHLRNSTTPYYIGGGPGTFAAVYTSGLMCSLLYLLELAVALVHSCYACRAACCCVPSVATDFRFAMDKPTAPKALVANYLAPPPPPPPSSGVESQQPLLMEPPRA